MSNDSLLGGVLDMSGWETHLGSFPRETLGKVVAVRDSMVDVDIKIPRAYLEVYLPGLPIGTHSVIFCGNDEEGNPLIDIDHHDHMSEPFSVVNVRYPLKRSVAAEAIDRESRWQEILKG